MDNYFNALWLIVITITTVGYGDVSPCTNPGRLIAMISALWGAFLISLLVLTVGNVFELKHQQQMALRHIRLTRRAAVTISTGIKYFLAKKRYYQVKQCIAPKKAENSMFVSLLKTGSQAARNDMLKSWRGGGPMANEVDSAKSYDSDSTCSDDESSNPEFVIA